MVSRFGKTAFPFQALRSNVWAILPRRYVTTRALGIRHHIVGSEAFLLGMPLWHKTVSTVPVQKTFVSTNMSSKFSSKDVGSWTIPAGVMM